MKKQRVSRGKLLSIILSVLLVFSMIPASVFAADAVDVAGLSDQQNTQEIVNEEAPDVVLPEANTGELSEESDAVAPTQPEKLAKSTSKAPVADTIGNPNLFDSLEGYGMVEKTYDGKDYYEMHAVMRATNGPGAGEQIYAYCLDDHNIYGASEGRTVKAYIRRTVYSSFNLADEKERSWMLVSAKSPAEAGEIAEANASKATKLAFWDYSKIDVNMPRLYGFSYSTSGNSEITVTLDRDKPGTVGKAEKMEVYNYDKANKREGDLYQEFTFSDEIRTRQFTITGLAPNEARYLTVHTVKSFDGAILNYWDGYYRTVSTAEFEAATISPVKLAPNKVMITIKLPYGQNAAGYSTMYVYCGNTKIKTLKSNGKDAISFVYKGKNAVKQSYKVQSVLNDNPEINKMSDAKKPVNNTYKRQGYINPNINAIVPYGRATFVPWSMTYYDGKVKITGYIVNNRMFTLKNYKFKVTSYCNDKKVASKTASYKKIKQYGYKKVTITMKTKKTPDFVNNSRGWATSNIKTNWGF